MSKSGLLPVWFALSVSYLLSVVVAGTMLSTGVLEERGSGCQDPQKGTGLLLHPGRVVDTCNPGNGEVGAGRW